MPVFCQLNFFSTSYYYIYLINKNAKTDVNYQSQV